MLVVEVVPTVATTQNGRQPFWRSSVMACASAAGIMRNDSSTGILRNPSSPIPRVMADLSMEE